MGLKKNMFRIDKFEAIKRSLVAAFKQIKNEFNEHLETINQNTTEIQGLYDYLSEVEQKIDKLNERMDEMQMSVNPDMNYEQFSVELTHREQEVFMILYAEQEKINAQTIAKKLGFTDEMVHRYIYNLITKGIPIIKHFEKEEMLLALDVKFKDLQARRNILKINESISQQLLSDKIL
ncbi:MAG: HTH domain-containing protein [Candidatus Woesearchaeota archaeon]